jgi:hypothetical protein
MVWMELSSQFFLFFIFPNFDSSFIMFVNFISFWLYFLFLSLSCPFVCSLFLRALDLNVGLFVEMMKAFSLFLFLCIFNSGFWFSLLFLFELFNLGLVVLLFKLL